MQLKFFGSRLPAWAWSRWILAQAARSLHESQRESGRRAFDLAEEVRRPVLALRGVDELDADPLLSDDDWVLLAGLLYDEGALEAFLVGVASAGPSSPPIPSGNGWGAPMSALQFADESSKTLAGSTSPTTRSFRRRTSAQRPDCGRGSASWDGWSRRDRVRCSTAFRSGSLARSPTKLRPPPTTRPMPYGAVASVHRQVPTDHDRGRAVALVDDVSPTTSRRRPRVRLHGYGATDAFAAIVETYPSPVARCFARRSTKPSTTSTARSARGRRSASC